MNQQSPIERIVNSKFYPLLLFFVSFVFVTLFSRSTSFLYITEGSDPSLFKSMGMAILKGHTLYIDYFDNKGYILYFIYALGVWLGGNLPLLLMQSLSLTITLIIWDKMLALYRDEHFRFIGLAVALLLLLCFYTEGGLTQEWCLPLASYPLLIYFRSLKTKQAPCTGEDAVPAHYPQSREGADDHFLALPADACAAAAAVPLRRAGVAGAVL